MREITKTLFSVMFAVGIGGALQLSSALAAPGDGDEQPRLQILDSTAAPSTCVSSDGLCLAPGAAATVAMGPSDTAVAGRAAGEQVPRFVRVPAPGASHAAVGDDVPWTVDVVGTMRRPALAGNALFILYDAQDERAVAEREVTALWQAPIHAGTSVAARLLLSGDDGFRSGHTYRLQVAQLIGGKQVVLTEGTLRLQ